MTVWVAFLRAVNVGKRDGCTHLAGHQHLGKSLDNVQVGELGGGFVAAATGEK